MAKAAPERGGGGGKALGCTDTAADRSLPLSSRGEDSAPSAVTSESSPALRSAAGEASISIEALAQFVPPSPALCAFPTHMVLVGHVTVTNAIFYGHMQTLPILYPISCA